MTQASTTNEDEAKRFADHLESKIAALLVRIEASDVYQSVFDPRADPRYLATVIKYVMLEVFSYGPHVTEATFTAVGRMPKNRPDLMKVMIHHDLMEVDHCEMALKDFVRLGGDETWARSRRMTPASWAMAAVCRMLAQCESPFAYLGYMYPFESLTPILTERIQGQLASKGFPTEAQKFIDLHATEDIAHTKILRTLVERVVRDFPDAASAIEYGFECFAVVYPLPIWEAAVSNARIELGRKR
jgi:heme oxygenase-like protein